MKCPSCGSDAQGAFCSNCGTRLASERPCKRCGAAMSAGSRFCTQCGARAGADARWMRYALPIALVGAALAAGYWLGRGGEATDEPIVPTTIRDGAVPGGSPPPLTGSMRDQADRLFERIMQARSRGDTAEVRFFLPMALEAYGAAGPLDADGLFHLGVLQLEGGRTAEAARTAAQLRTADDGLLFGFALTAEAALAAGDTALARTAYRDYLSSYETEIARDLPEYRLHGPALDAYRTEARTLVES